MKLKIGADPELFLKHAGEYKSAFGMIPGTKEAPHPVPKGAVQVDGMALEFNINPAASSRIFVNNIDKVLKSLRDMVPEEYEFCFHPTASFTRGHMLAQPAEALDLGCDIDYNAYNGRPNPKPDGYTAMRTAAGHVHIGWKRSNNKIDLRHFEASRLLVKQLDYMLGVPSVLLDKVCARRMMYGSAGAFRPKKYGAEYRVLSNFWLKDKALMKWVFDSTQAAFNLLEEGVHLSDRFHSPREIINYSRKEDAQGLIDKGLWKYIIDNGVLQ